MATVALAKPATLGTAVLQIVRSDNLTATMALKLQVCDVDYRQVVEDTTGSNATTADTNVTVEGSGLLGGQIALQGLLMSTATAVDWIGIENMFSTTDAISRMRWSVGLANGIYLRGSMIVESCRIRWVRTAATVQVTIQGRITDTAPTTTEATTHYAAP